MMADPDIGHVGIFKFGRSRLLTEYKWNTIRPVKPRSNSNPTHDGDDMADAAMLKRTSGS
jgi:hypothetical protein